LIEFRLAFKLYALKSNILRTELKEFKVYGRVWWNIVMK